MDFVKEESKYGFGVKTIAYDGNTGNIWFGTSDKENSKYKLLPLPGINDFKPEFANLKEKQKSEGYFVSEVAYGEQRYIVTFTSNIQRGFSYWDANFNRFKGKITEYAQKGYGMYSVDYADGKWFGCFSKESKSSMLLSLASFFSD